MPRSCAFLLILLVFVVSFVTPMEGRKVLISKKEMSEMQVPHLYWSLVLSALPKGTVPYPAPSKNGHATLDNEKLFVRHLASIDRILWSVPSPGAGH
ncbi:hypothetical protein SLE2022_304490 [Rubroshorea leprosula]